MKIEILAPVGDFEMLAAAIKAGADSVYLGIKGMNMRASAKNFSIPELRKAVSYAHKHGVRVYLTLNTIIFEDELKKISKTLDAAKKAKVDAVIAWDLAVLKLAKEKKIEAHLSTQASVSNHAALEEYRKMGIKRVVLARECSLKEIRNIARRSKAEVEAFAHGAMCISESGRCFMSQFQYGKSANRGECLQPCRREYIIRDAETGDELGIKGHYVLSPKDLCTMPFIDKLVKSGIRALKIEGRARSPEYVYTVVKAYKEAVMLAQKGKLNDHKKKELTEKLKEVYNRDFSGGFFMGRPIKDFWNKYGGKSKYKKEFAGKIINHYAKAGAFYAKLNSGRIKKGDMIWIIGPSTGIIEHKITSLRDEKGKEISSAAKGERFTCSIDQTVRKNDRIYRKVRCREG